MNLIQFTDRSHPGFGIRVQQRTNVVISNEIVKKIQIWTFHLNILSQAKAGSCNR